MSVSILVPVKDEAPSITQLAAEVAAAMGPDVTWELLFIDDGSTDSTWDRVLEACRTHRQVQGVRCRRNVGKSTALAIGVAETVGDVVVTMDGDLQDDPAEIPGMVARLGDEADMVAGRKRDRKDPLGKRVPSRLFNSVTGALTGLRLRDHNCGLKVGFRDVFTSVPLYGELHRYIAAVAHAEGFRVVEHDVNHRPRLHGRSKFGMERYVRGGIDLLTMVTLTRYGRRPAHLFGGFGVLSGAVGTAILLYLTGLWFLSDEPIGTRPLLLLGVLLLLLGVQLLCFGLIAEMLVRREAQEDDPTRHLAGRAPTSRTSDRAP